MPVASLFVGMRTSCHLRGPPRSRHDGGMTQQLHPVTSAPQPNHADVPSAEAAPEGVWLFATFRVSSSHPIVLDGREVPGVVRELEDVVGIIEGEGVRVRGCYDVSGFRSDADLLVWLTGTAAEDLQWAYRELRRTQILNPLVRVSSFIAVSAVALADEIPGWLAVTSVPAGQSAQAISLSSGAGIIALETADSATLFPLIAGGLASGGSAAGGSATGELLHLGRLVTPAEVVEVLQ